MNKSLLLLFLSPLFIFGQTLDPNAFYNKGAAVTIQNGALLHIQGTLTNDASGTINTDGVIELKGDIDNTGGNRFYPANPNSGTEKVVKFIGDGTQAIKGDFNTHGSRSFYNLVVDKSAASSAVELQHAVEVEGSLVFGSATSSATYTPTAASQLTNNNKKGVINTFDVTNTDYDLYVSNGAIAAIAGHPSLQMSRGTTFHDNYVQTRGALNGANGGLIRKVNQQGSFVPHDHTTDYDFPIGTSTHGFEAIRFNFHSLPLGDDKVRGMFRDGASNSNGIVGHVTQTCIGCANLSQLDNAGINLAFGTTWPGSLPNPCAVPGHQQQWVVLEDDLANFGYWSFHSDNSGTDASSYSVETFPRGFVDNGVVEPYYSEETWRTMHYNSPVTDDPSGPSANWNQDLYAVSNITDLVEYTRNSGCYPFTEPGVPGGVYTGFSHFAIKKSKTHNALPVELIDFSATAVDNQYIRLDWATAIEINNAGFWLERSTDGIGWSSITWVDGHNNSTVQNNYTYPDHAVAADIVYYYRLKQVDNDGAFTYTDIVSARLNGGLTFSVADFVPNPTMDKTNLVITASKDQDITVTFYDVIGQKMIESLNQLNKGNNKLEFDLGKLASGTYTAVISSSNEVYTKKVVLTK